MNLIVSAWLFRRAAETESPALEGDAAHLRTDAYTSLGVLVGLALVHWTGCEWLDPAVALLIAGAIVVTGLSSSPAPGACSSTRRCPPEELAAIRDAIEDFAGGDVVGYHQLRTRRAGARRYVDLHVQFRAGTTLEDAHGIAHELQDRIAAPPARRRRPDPPRARGQGPRGPDRRRAAHREPPDVRALSAAQRRLMAAASATANTTPA